MIYSEEYSGVDALDFGADILAVHLCAGPRKLSANIRCKQPLKVMCAVDTLTTFALYSFLGVTALETNNVKFMVWHGCISLIYTLTFRSFIDCKAFRYASINDAGETYFLKKTHTHTLLFGLCLRLRKSTLHLPSKKPHKQAPSLKCVSRGEQARE